jgi:DNA-binding NarL/FixJ family response regulator
MPGIIAKGAPDMEGDADLAGCRVLVVEDDYILASGVVRALRETGISVLGSVGREDQALALIANEAPTCAIVNINLGDGPRFKVSEALQDAGVPFTFVTGYGDEVIPARFDTVKRLLKPVPPQELVQAVVRLCMGKMIA